MFEGKQSNNTLHWNEEKKTPSKEKKKHQKNPTKNTTPIYFVNMNGIKWPRCIDSEDGPLPVYK